MKLTPQTFYKVSHKDMDEDVSHILTFDDIKLAIRYCKQLQLKSYKIWKCDIIPHGKEEIEIKKTLLVKKTLSRFTC